VGSADDDVARRLGISAVEIWGTAAVGAVFLAAGLAGVLSAQELARFFGWVGLFFAVCLLVRAPYLALDRRAAHRDWRESMRRKDAGWPGS
jgi:hypothetical protein